jgi:hypothetical protein
MKDLLWFVLDVVIGLAAAGVLAPLAVVALPREIQGPWLLWVTAIVCVGLVMVLRRLIAPGTTSRGARQ